MTSSTIKERLFLRFASVLFNANRCLGRRGNSKRGLEEELVLFFGNNEFFDAYSRIAYEHSPSYHPESSRCRTELFDWERRLVGEHFPKPPARILVGGAGGGREAFALCDLGYEVVAFDPVETLCEAMAGEAESRGLALSVLAGGYEYFAEDGTKGRALGNLRPLGRVVEKGFDVVLLGWGSLNHLVNPQIRRSLFVKCSSVLNPGGVLAASFFVAKEGPDGGKGTKEWSIRKPRDMVLRLLGLHPNDRFFFHAGFCHQFEEQELQSLGENAGLDVLLFNDGSRGEYPHCLMVKSRGPSGILV